MKKELLLLFFFQLFYFALSFLSRLLVPLKWRQFNGDFSPTPHHERLLYCISLSRYNTIFFLMCFIAQFWLQCSSLTTTPRGSQPPHSLPHFPNTSFWGFTTGRDIYKVFCWHNWKLGNSWDLKNDCIPCRRRGTYPTLTSPIVFQGCYITSIIEYMSALKYVSLDSIGLTPRYMHIRQWFSNFTLQIFLD